MNKQQFSPLSYENFVILLNYLKRDDSGDYDIIFEIYYECVNVLNIHHSTFSELPFVPLDHVRLTLFILGDYDFKLGQLSNAEKEKSLDNEEFSSGLINAIIDKYGGVSYFKYDEGKLISPYSTEISTINVYTNFILLKLQQISINSEEEKLFIELLKNAFSFCRTITELLTNGFEKEALSTWRSLHELEATLLLLGKNKDVISVYRKHIMYNAAFNNILEKTKGDDLFLQMKKEMRHFGLKSKDIRRYIEYGWITALPEFDINVHRYNFRDGVEALSGLISARDDYQIASEVTHASPLMLFGDRSYFLLLTLNRIYESFSTIEALFAEIFNEKLQQNEFDYYQQIRAQYLKDISFVIDTLKRK